MLRTAKSKIVISVSVSAFFVASLLAGVTTAEIEDVSTESLEQGEDSLAKWNVLVYLVADNDLDMCIPEDFQEFRDGGSSDEVNVLLLVDRFEEPAYLYTIEGNDMVVLEEMGEINMGDPQYLTGLMDYADLNCPSERTVLFFWDHGTATAGVGADWTLAEGDEPGSGWDWLSHHEVVEALDGYHLDVIATDECCVGQMETIYEYSYLGLDVDYIVASESYIGYRGFLYDKIVQALVLNPDMDGRELSLVIVEWFTYLFTQAPYKCETLTTQSIFDMSKIPALGEAVTAMADGLAADIESYRSIVRSAQMGAIMPWGLRCENIIDMPLFVELVMEGLAPNDPVRPLCEDVLAAFDETLIGMGIAKNTEMYGYKGMGILFPASHSSYTVAYADTDWGGFNTYITFEFPNMGWWEFLQTYWGLV